MKSFERAVRRAYEVYNNRDHYCYLYGAKGIELTRANFEYFKSAYPSYFAQYTAEQLEQYFQDNEGKIALDCSGFVNYCFDWLPKRYSKAYYDHKQMEYESWMQSEGGALLFTTRNGLGRHIGIDVGSGYFIDAASEMQGIRMLKFADFPNYWEHCFRAEDTDYEGASARMIYTK